MNIIDISWPLSERTTAYKDIKTLSFTPSKTIENDNVRQTMITFSSHTGTHVDAPSHFLPDGGTTEHIALSTLVGPCTVVDMTHVNDAITAHDLKEIVIKPDSIVLFKTMNSMGDSRDLFNYKFVYIAHDAAQFLVDAKIRSVGIDYLGIERNQPNHPTHTLFMKNTITIIEGLRLAPVRAGNYFLVCLPLLLQGLDGAPARAILLDQW